MKNISVHLYLYIIFVLIAFNMQNSHLVIWQHWTTPERDLSVCVCVCVSVLWWYGLIAAQTSLFYWTVSLQT